MGDVLNTNSRTKEAWKKHNAGLLASKELMNKLELPERLLTEKQSMRSFAEKPNKSG